ncbi:hypothetical protein FSY75_09135 [Streptomyces sp. TR1341]|uniref:hypothetical protein n=1 Tax=Streptomyces sp. TR1341 TaxID=2601266 RepID=UPI00138ABB96|nr:hypothetical protein [Streptomyces sp. TR1341]
MRQRSRASLRAEAEFRARVEALGGTILESEYLNSRTPHRVRCAAGHGCRPTPSNVQKGWGLCTIGAARDAKAAEAAFRQRLDQLGAVLLEAAYLGSKRGHRVRCAAGHECRPRPKDLAQGGGLCRTCAGDLLRGVSTGRNPVPEVSEEVEQRFRERVSALGGTVLAARWEGVGTPTLVRCAEGHEVFPTPSNVLRGTGLCRLCSGKEWDVFYVVTDGGGTVKFGITSGDPTPRLQYHARDNLTRVVRLHTGLPDTTAPDLERLVLAALREAGEVPVRGKEYFPARVLSRVLALVDQQLAV